MKRLLQLSYPSSWPITIKLWVALFTTALLPFWMVSCETPQRYFNTIAVSLLATVIALILARMIAHPIRVLLAAEKVLEEDDFDVQSLALHHKLAGVSDTHDEIGQLVRVFMEMVEVIRLRDQKLRLQVLELEIEVDEAKRACQVNEIVETEYFQQIQKKAFALKKRDWKDDRSESDDYFHLLHDQAQAMKKGSSRSSDREVSMSLETG